MNILNSKGKIIGATELTTTYAKINTYGKPEVIIEDIDLIQ